MMRTRVPLVFVIGCRKSPDRGPDQPTKSCVQHRGGLVRVGRRCTWALSPRRPGPSRVIAGINHQSCRSFGRHAGDPSDRVKNNRNIPFPSDAPQLSWSRLLAVGFPLGDQAGLGKVNSGGSAPG